jgi:hypothetical protein
MSLRSRDLRRAATQRLASLTRSDWLRLAALVGVAVVLAACAAPTGSGAPSGSLAPSPIPTPLVPAELKPDPISVLSWAFTPIFQAFFLLLVGLDQLVGDIGIAIILTTLIVRTAMVPLMRRQMVSMRQMQSIQPEIKEIQRRFKGDRLKQQSAMRA